MAGPLLGYRAPLCKVEKTYSPGATLLGKDEVPFSGLCSSMSGYRAKHAEHWLDWSLRWVLYAVHSLDNQKQQPSLADSGLIHYSIPMPDQQEYGVG